MSSGRARVSKKPEQVSPKRLVFAADFSVLVVPTQIAWWVCLLRFEWVRHNEVEELGNVRLFLSMWVKHIEEFKLPQHFPALHLRQATACSQNCDASSSRQHLVDFVSKAGTQFLPCRIRIKFRFRPS